MLWRTNYDATEGWRRVEEGAVPEMPLYVFEELPRRADRLVVLSALAATSLRRAPSRRSSRTRWCSS